MENQFDSSVFSVGNKFRINCYETFQLFTMGSSRKLIEFNDDIVMQVQEFGSGGYLWLVYTDSNGKQYGLAVQAMLGYERKGKIEIEPMVETIAK